MLLAVWGVRALTLLLANGEDHFTIRAEMNWRVLLATLVVSLLCGTLFGLAPALQSTRADVMPALKDVRTGAIPSRRRGFRWLSLSRALVVSQIAVSLLLLITAALFVRTLSNLHAVELGFNQQNVLLFDVNARQAGHQDPEIATFYADLASGACRNSRRPVRHAVSSLDHQRRHAAAHFRVGQGSARDPVPDRRPRVLHDDADSDAARPRDRPLAITPTRHRSRSSTSGSRR